MRVIVKSWGAEVTQHLDDVLTPSAGPYEYSGTVEEARGVANKTAEAFGKLAELLVEKGVITLDEALQCVDARDLYVRLIEKEG